MISEPNTLFFDTPAMNDYSITSTFCMLKSIIAHLYRKLDRLTFNVWVTTSKFCLLTYNVAYLTCNVAKLTFYVWVTTSKFCLLTCNVAYLTCNVVKLTFYVWVTTLKFCLLTCNVDALTFYVASPFKSTHTQISTLNINEINNALQPFNNALYQYINRNESSNLKIQMYEY